MSEEKEFQDVDLDTHLSASASEYPDEIEMDPVLADLSDEEKELLIKIEDKRMKQDFIIQTFKELEHRPTDEEIEGYKGQVGDVFLLSLSEKENFVFRPLKRLEWRALIQKIQKLDEMKQAEAICMKSCLWPRLDQQNINVLTAGAVETLRDSILQVSNFMGPETAMQLLRKL